ncbi:MAG: DNA polymerase III subunit gamma/tau [Cyanobacteria bacterium]|nr:DNA polymerase III subunit gamma/tau [Cyanobacteriota bacterium]
MSKIETYVPLYRKYRPQAFGDLVGQDAISSTLGNAMDLNKVAHAYLFCGPRGTGKTSTARIFAKSLNCEQGPTFTPCQTCASCVGITQGNALDVIEFDAASNNKVEDARELIESCQFAPLAGKFKIYIIDEVHMLTPQAFNALLKTLEEPPPNVVFIFATTEGHKVLPTIISRCQRFDFNRITSQDIIRRLEMIAEKESILIDTDALLMIARHARGGLRDAVGLLDQVAVLGRAHPGKTISSKDLTLLIGALEEDLLFSLFKAVGERDAQSLMQQLNDLTNRGVEPVQLCKEMIQHGRNLLIVKVSGANIDPGLLGISQESLNLYVQQAQQFLPEELPQILWQLSRLEYTVRSTSQPQLWLEVGLLELSYRQDILMVKELSERVSQLEAALSRGSQAGPMSSNPKNLEIARPAHSNHTQVSQQQAPSHVTQSVEAHPLATPPAIPPASPQVGPTPSGGLPLAGGTGPQHMGLLWQDICKATAHPPTKALLQQHFSILELSDFKIVLGCTSEPTLSTLKNPTKMIHLQKAVDGVLGKAVVIEFELVKKTHVEKEEAPVQRVSPPSQQPPAPLPPSVSERAPFSNNEAPVHDSTSPVSDGGTEKAFNSQVSDSQVSQGPEFQSPPQETLVIQPAQAFMTSEIPETPVNPDDLIEAKKYTMDLLQGKVID